MLQRTFFNKGVTLTGIYNKDIEEMKPVRMPVYTISKQLKQAV